MYFPILPVKVKQKKKQTYINHPKHSIKIRMTWPAHCLDAFVIMDVSSVAFGDLCRVLGAYWARGRCLPVAPSLSVLCVNIFGARLRGTDLAGGCITGATWTRTKPTGEVCVRVTPGLPCPRLVPSLFCTCLPAPAETVVIGCLACPAPAMPSDWSSDHARLWTGSSLPMWTVAGSSLIVILS